MSSWINTDWTFAEGRCTLFITHEDMLTKEGLGGALRAAMMHTNSEDNRPEAIESQIRSLLRRYRPELDDATICYMRFNGEFARWEFGISHPSLPRVPMGACAPKEPLLPPAREVKHELDS